MKKIVAFMLFLTLLLSSLLLSGCSKKDPKAASSTASKNSSQTQTSSKDGEDTSSPESSTDSSATQEDSKNPGVKAVETVISSLGECKFEKAQSLLLPKIDMDPEEPFGADEPTRKKMAQIFAKISYKIISVKEVDEKTVDIVMEINASDFKTIFSNYMVKAFEISRSGPQFTDEQIAEKMDAAFAECLADKTVKTRNTKLTVKVIKTDDVWMVQDSREFAYACLGGSLSVHETEKALEGLF